MGRSEANQAFQQSQAQSAQDQTAAQAANAATNKSLDKYKQRLDAYTSDNPYVQGGEYDQNLKTLGASVSAGEENSAEGAQNSAAARMGVSSSPQLAANTDEMRRESRRSFGNFLANNEQNRIAQENEVQKFGVQATALPADVQARIYGTSISGATGAGTTAMDAATRSKGFGQTLGDAFATTLGENLAGGQGGPGKAVKGVTGCWIAEAIYGPTFETKLVRAWLNLSFTKTLKGRITMAAYRVIGRPVAFLVRHSSTLRAAIKPLFDKALTHAQAELKASNKHLPHAVMSHKPQLLEVQRPDGDMVNDAAECPPIVFFPEDLDSFGNLTLAEAGMVVTLVAWCFRPLQISANWKRPHAGWFPFDAHTIPVLWEFAGCHRPEVWEKSRDRVLAMFGRSADGKWLIAPPMFMRWKIVK